MYNYSIPTVMPVEPSTSEMMDLEEPKPKTVKEQILEEAESLEKPADSVEFLQYMMKHAEKVEQLQTRLQTFSKGLLGAGVLVAGYAAMCYFTATSQADSSKGRLQASHGAQVEESMSSTFNGLSVVIWSMIAAKAKTGLNAASSGEAKSVGQSLKNAGALILMIALASGFNIYAQQYDLNIEIPQEAIDTAANAGAKMLQAGRDLDKQVGGETFDFFNDMSIDDFKKENIEKNQHKLQAQAPQEPLSSHYKGGVAAAAFDQFAKMSADDFKKANIASNSVKGRKVELEAPPTLEKSKRQAGINLVIEALEKKKTAVSPLLKQMRNNQQLKETGAYLLFLLTTGLSVAFYVTFKSYHSALTKLNALKKLLASPNARVAHGETGKSILKRLRAEQQKIEAPALITKTTKSNETVDLLKQLIEARQTEKEYAAPLLEQTPKRLTAAKQPDNSLELIK